MKTISIDQSTLDACVQEAQRERVMITRDGVPVALIVGVEGLDEEQLRLSSSHDFWQLIAERRQQKTLTRNELDRRLSKGRKRK